eukprot:gene7019-9589_t
MSISQLWRKIFRPYSEINEDTVLRDKYAECLNSAEKMLWLESARGQAIIAKRPILLEYYRNGRLKRMVNDPHWSLRLNEWLHETLNPSDIILSLQSNVPPEKNRSEFIQPNGSHPPPRILFTSSPYIKEIISFPTESKYKLLIDGYTILPQLVPYSVVDNAENFVNEHVILPALSSTIASAFNSYSTDDPSILALMYESPLHSLLQSLIYGDKDKNLFYSYPFLAHGAQLAIRYSENGTRKPLYGLGWHLDGMDKGQYSPFAFLVGIALNDQLHDYSGNLCLHSGSHHTLQSYLKNYALKVISNTSTTAPFINPEQYHRELRIEKPDLGEPVQILLKKGDVIIVHSRVGHRGGPNLSESIRKMVYFRVSHHQHNDMKLQGLDDMWIESVGMRDIL